MTDLEISKALALAIGYTDGDSSATRNIQKSWDEKGLLLQVYFNGMWRTFDYRDWNVIGPIAERYDCFPTLMGYGLWSSRIRDGKIYDQDTPQKAIAMAVIGAKK